MKSIVLASLGLTSVVTVGGFAYTAQADTISSMSAEPSAIVQTQEVATEVATEMVEIQVETLASPVNYTVASTF